MLHETYTDDSLLRIGVEGVAEELVRHLHVENPHGDLGARVVDNDTGASLLPREAIEVGLAYLRAAENAELANARYYRQLGR